MEKYFLIFLVFLFIVLLPSGFVFPSDISELQDKTKESFMQIEDVWRIPKEKQKEGIVKIYKEVLPSIYFIPFSDTTIPNQFLKIPENLSTNELANWFLKEHRLSQFMRYTKSRGLNLLRENIQETKRLIKIDLLSATDKERERALMYISEFKLSEFNEDVLGIFLHSTELESKAAYTMRDLQMYDGIKFLVSKPENPTKYFEILRTLQKNKKAHDSILPLLDSPDSEIRWKSAYALAESGDEILIPYIKKLIKDQKSEVRKQAAYMGFFLKDCAYKKVYSDLVTLLSDKDRSVRIEVVCMFSWNKDIVCAKAMLDLLRDNSLEERSHSRIWQAMHNLCGNYFGYYHGSDGWKPKTKNNKISIKKFEEWIANNKVK
jgi:hypothetical protein